MKKILLISLWVCAIAAGRAQEQIAIKKSKFASTKTGFR
jgi:hypothetical protein